MPGAMIFGIMAGLLEVVPNLGPILAMIPAVITALIQGSNVLGPMGIDNVGFALITVGIYFLIQQLENNILVPRIIGDSINLHPIIVICAVVVGLSVGRHSGRAAGPAHRRHLPCHRQLRPCQAARLPALCRQPAAQHAAQSLPAQGDRQGAGGTAAGGAGAQQPSQPARRPRPPICRPSRAVRSAAGYYLAGSARLGQTV